MTVFVETDVLLAIVKDEDWLQEGAKQSSMNVKSSPHRSPTWNC
jgi:hypothetical protein